MASPSLAAARTLAFSTVLPSERTSIPSRASRPPRGVSRTARRRPSAVAVQGRDAASGANSEDRGVEIKDDDALDEEELAGMGRRRQAELRESHRLVAAGLTKRARAELGLTP